MIYIQNTTTDRAMRFLIKSKVNHFAPKEKVVPGPLVGKDMMVIATNGTHCCSFMK